MLSLLGVYQKVVLANPLKTLLVMIVLTIAMEMG